MQAAKFIESLETRELFSVSAVVLTGPLITGAQYSYERLTGTKVTASKTEKVVGPATFNGHKGIELQTTFFQGASKSVQERYLAVNNTSGYELLGVVAGETTTTFNPVEIEAPPTLTAGKVYTSKFAGKITTVSGSGATQTQSASYVGTVELMSNTLQAVKVPAGTYKAYVVDSTLTTTINGKSVTEKEQDWFVPGIGEVKSTYGIGSSIFTYELTSYKA